MSSKRGPGTNEEQVESLSSKLSEEDIAAAHDIVDNNSKGVVTLAYKLMRIETAKNKPLPKAVDKALANLPTEDAADIREKLENARK